ncbi:L-threonine ammonia-lyase-like [Vanessa tameamea]|uniref:L-serine deaminase n=1 Tax=Vanessa tameamea TaxID=334116 RepID=A0A8B8IB24_VANTA|nr:uncharacterized protein LOC113399355 [Vanessa tameamea]
MELYENRSSTVEFDPMCDKENPQRISFEDVSAAAFRIQSGITKTPCVKSHMSSIYGMDIYLKNDFLQYTGSFKERGARNALLLLSPEAKERGVISASLGNHSQGLSYHAKQLNIPVTVVMPNVAPIMKIENCRSYGANVIIHGHDMKEAKYYAMMLAKEKGLVYINGYDHPHIMAGQGTVALEILEQVPDIDAVLVPVGGGGLLAGVVTAVKHLKPHVLIYGVETEKCPSMEVALEKGEPVSVEIRSTLADGLAVSTVGYNAFATVQSLIDRMITVNEDWIARAILRLAEQEKYVVEGGGAVGVSAIMAGHVPELAAKKVVCILSGGNIDTTIFGRCLERGLAAEQRLVKFKVTVSDRPGGIAELCKLIASIGVSIKDIIQERAWVYGDIFSVRVKVVCETRGPEHMNQLRSMITNTYKEWYFSREPEDCSSNRRPSTDSLDDVSK